MNIQITRIDPLGNMPYSQAPHVLSDNAFHDWPEALEFLRDHNVQVSPAIEAQLREWSANDLCTFSSSEFVQGPNVAYVCPVRYEILITYPQEETT